MKYALRYSWLIFVAGIIVVFILLYSRNFVNSPSSVAPRAQVIDYGFESPIDPTPTLEPLPTAIPTPQTTVVPTAVPPYIDDIVEVPLQPFWIYYWRGNEIWRIDSAGNDNQLLTDVLAALGRPFTIEPEPGTDCCDPGPRLTLSADGKQLALVLPGDYLEGSESEHSFSLYRYTIDTKEYQYIGEGSHPRWSADSRLLAFRNRGSLWVGDGATGRSYELISAQQEKTQTVADYVWSPKSSQLAFTYMIGSYQLVPEIWIVSIDQPHSPKLLLQSDTEIYGLHWSPDARRILYLSEWSKDRYPFNHFRDLWAVDVNTGKTTALTQEMTLSSVQLLAYQPWIAFSAFRGYEFLPDTDVDYDIWLLNPDKVKLVRITADSGNFSLRGEIGQQPYLLVVDDNAQLYTLSLIDGVSTPIELPIKTDYVVGGTK